jgi:hypothetical protein
VKKVIQRQAVRLGEAFDKRSQQSPGIAVFPSSADKGAESVGR